MTGLRKHREMPISWLIFPITVDGVRLTKREFLKRPWFFQKAKLRAYHTAHNRKFDIEMVLNDLSFLGFESFLDVEMKLSAEPYIERGNEAHLDTAKRWASDMIAAHCAKLHPNEKAFIETGTKFVSDFEKAQHPPKSPLPKHNAS